MSPRSREELQNSILLDVMMAVVEIRTTLIGLIERAEGLPADSEEIKALRRSGDSIVEALAKMKELLDVGES